MQHQVVVSDASAVVASLVASLWWLLYSTGSQGLSVKLGAAPDEGVNCHWWLLSGGYSTARTAKPGADT